MAIGHEYVGHKRVVIAVTLERQGDSGEPVMNTITDSAVDRTESDLAAYESSLWDVDAHIKFRDGDEPTWFTIQPLTRRQWDHIEKLDVIEQANFAIRAAVLSHEGYFLKDADGATTIAPQPKRKPNGTFGPMAQDSWLDRMNIHPWFKLALLKMIKKVTEVGDPLSSS